MALSNGSQTTESSCMNWLCVPKGGASVVSLCVGCFRAPGVQEALLNCTACIQLMPLSGPGRLLPLLRQAVLSPIISMHVLQCPAQEQQDALVVLYRSGELALLVYSPGCQRFITIQHVMLAPGAAAQHTGHLLLAAPSGRALAVAAWQDRLHLLPVTWQPEEQHAAAAAAAQRQGSTKEMRSGPAPHCDGSNNQGCLLLPVVGTGMVVQLNEGDVAGAKATYATCPEVGAPLAGAHTTVWHAAFLGTPPDVQQQLLAVLIHRPGEHASEVQVWSWQAQAGALPQLLAALPCLHSPPKGSRPPLGLPLGLLPLPGDTPGVVLHGTSGLQHLMLRLPPDSAWAACDIADMDQDEPLLPRATPGTTPQPGLSSPAEACSSCPAVCQPVLVEGPVLDLAAVLQATRPSLKQQQQEQQQQRQQLLEPLVSAAVWCTLPGPASAPAAAASQHQHKHQHQQQPVLLVSSSTGGVLCIRLPDSPTARLQARLCSVHAPVRPAQAVAAVGTGQLLWLEADGDLLLVEVQPGSSTLPRPVALRSAGIQLAPIDTPPGMQPTPQQAPAPPDLAMAAAASPVVGGRKASSPHADPPCVEPPSAAREQEGGWGPVAHPIMQLTDSDSISPSTTLSPEEVTAAAAAAAAAAAGEGADLAGVLPRAPLAHLPLPMAPPGLHLAVAARLPQLGPVLSALVVPGGGSGTITSSSSGGGGPGSRGEGGGHTGEGVLIAAGPHGLQRWSSGAATAVVGASPPGLLPALTGLWALPWAPEGPTHHLLLLSCATGTRALAAGPSSSSWQDASDEVCPHLAGQQLVAAGCIAAGLLVLATSEALMLCPWELPGATSSSGSPAEPTAAPAAGGTQGGAALPADLSQLPPPVAAVSAADRPRGPLENAFWSAWSRAWHGSNTGMPGGSNGSSGGSGSGRVHTPAPAVQQQPNAPISGAGAAVGADMAAAGEPAAAAAAAKSASPLWQWHWAPEHGLEFWSRHHAAVPQQASMDAMEEDATPPGAAQQQFDGHGSSLSCAAVCAGYVAVQLAPQPLLVLLRLVDGTSPSSSSRRSHGSSGTSSGSLGGGEVPVELQRSRKRSRLGQHLLEVAVGALPVQVSCLALAADPCATTSSTSLGCHPLVCAGTYDGAVAVFAACSGSAALQQLVTVPLSSPAGRQLPLPAPVPPTGPLLVPHSCCWLPAQPWQAMPGPMLAVGSRGGTLALLSLPSSALQAPSSTAPSSDYAAAPAGVAATAGMAGAAAAALGRGGHCQVLSQLELGRAPLHVECLPRRSSQGGASAEALQLLVVGEGAWRVTVAAGCGRLCAQRLDVGSSTPWVVALRPPSGLLGCGAPAAGCSAAEDSSPSKHTALAAGRNPSFPTPTKCSSSSSGGSGGAAACSDKLLLAMVPSDGSLQLVSVSQDPLGHCTLLLPGAWVTSLAHHPRSGLMAAALVQPSSPGTPSRSPTAAGAARAGEAAAKGGSAAGGGGKERQRVALVDPLHGGIACSWWAPAGEAIVSLTTWEAAPGAYADQVSRAAGRRRSLLSSATPGGVGGSSSHTRRHSSGGAGAAGPGSSTREGMGGSSSGGGPASWHAPSSGLLSGEGGALQGLPQLLCRLQAASTSSPERACGAGGSPAAGRAAPVAVHPLLLVGSNLTAGAGDGCSSHLRVLQVLGRSEASSPPFGRSNQWHSAPVSAGGSTSSNSNSSGWGWSLQQVAWLRLPHVLHCAVAIDEQHILVSTGHVLAAYNLQPDGKLACVAHVLPRAPVTCCSVSPEGLMLAGDRLAGVVGYRLTHIQQPEGPPQASLDAVWVQQEVAPVCQVVALPGSSSSSGPAALVADAQGRLLQLGAWEAPLVPLRSLYTTAALQLPGPLAAFTLLGQAPHAASVLGGHLALVRLTPEQAAWLQRVLAAVQAVDSSSHRQMRLSCVGRPQQQRRAAAAAQPVRQPQLQCLLDAGAVTDFLGWPRSRQLSVAQHLLLTTGADAKGAAASGEEALVQLLAWLEALLRPA